MSVTWDYSHGSPPVWKGPMPMTVPTLAEQTRHGPLIAIAAGGNGGCALTIDGHIVPFGDDVHGEFRDLPTGGGFVQVAKAMAGGYALAPDGHIVPFGLDIMRTDLPTTGGFVQIDANGTTGCALTADGHIVMFGQRRGGAVPDAGGFVQVAVGSPFSLALSEDGSIVRFGRYASDEVDPEPPDSFVRVEVSDAESGSAGQRLVGLRSDGYVRPLFNDFTSPDGAGYKQVAYGSRGAYLLSSDGHIEVDAPGLSWTWDLPSDGGFVQLVAGRMAGYALTADGDVAAFGENLSRERNGLPLQLQPYFMQHVFVWDGAKFDPVDPMVAQPDGSFKVAELNVWDGAAWVK